MILQREARQDGQDWYAFGAWEPTDEPGQYREAMYLEHGKALGQVGTLLGFDEGQELDALELVYSEYPQLCYTAHEVRGPEVWVRSRVWDRREALSLDEEEDPTWVRGA